MGPNSPNHLRIPVTNPLSEAVPPYGAVRVTNTGTDPGLCPIAKPSTDSATNVYFAGENGIPASGGAGWVTRDEPAIAAMNPADGTPVNGQTWGTVANSFLLRLNKQGFRVEGPTGPGAAMVARVAAAATATSVIHVFVVAKTAEGPPKRYTVSDGTTTYTDVTEAQDYEARLDAPFNGLHPMYTNPNGSRFFYAHQTADFVTTFHDGFITTGSQRLTGRKRFAGGVRVEQHTAGPTGGYIDFPNAAETPGLFRMDGVRGDGQRSGYLQFGGTFNQGDPTVPIPYPTGTSAGGFLSLGSHPITVSNAGGLPLAGVYQFPGIYNRHYYTSIFTGTIYRGQGTDGLLAAITVPHGPAGFDYYWFANGLYIGWTPDFNLPLGGIAPPNLGLESVDGSAASGLAFSEVRYPPYLSSGLISIPAGTNTTVELDTENGSISSARTVVSGAGPVTITMQPGSMAGAGRIETRGPLLTIGTHIEPGTAADASTTATGPEIFVGIVVYPGFAESGTTGTDPSVTADATFFPGFAESGSTSYLGDDFYEYNPGDG